MKMTRLLCACLVVVMLAGMLAGCGSCNHKWLPADCLDPRTCYNCGLTDGEPTDTHLWEEATTDRPKTCSVCGLTDGDRIDVDDRFHTDACQPFFGSWEAQYETDGSQISMPDLSFEMKLTMTFTNEGELTVKTELRNKAKAEQAIATKMTQMLYDQYSANGMDTAQANAACQALHGMDIPEFSEYRAGQLVDLLSDTQNKVYYVEEDKLFSADDWDSGMTHQFFVMLTDGSMQLQDSEDAQPVAFVRIATVK